MSTATLYARFRGRGAFQPDEVRRLLQEIPDVRLASWFLSETKYVPINRMQTNLADIGVVVSLRKTTLLMLTEASEAAGQIEKALTDNRIDSCEAMVIQKEIETAERAIVTLREHVRQLTR